MCGLDPRAAAVIRIDAVWLAVNPIDMRTGVDRLLASVVQVFGAAQSHHGYLFANARSSRIKLLVHDGFGVWCAARRLNKGSFEWPRSAASDTASLTLSPEQFDALVLGLPWQPEHQGVELLWAQGERGRVRRCTSGPLEAALVQSPRGAPHAKAVVYEQLDAAGAGVGKEVAVVRLRGAEDLYDARQQPIGAGAHVDGLHRQPQGIDADHRSHSRSQAAQSPPHCTGQWMFTTVAPRRSSIRMSGCAAGAGCGGSVNAMNAPASSLTRARVPTGVVAGRPRRCHLRTRFAFKPFFCAIPATDAPSCAHSNSTRAFNAALCLRRDLLLASSMVSTYVLGGHHPSLQSRRNQYAAARRLPHKSSPRSTMSAGRSRRRWTNSRPIYAGPISCCAARPRTCLLYTSDAADDLLCVDLG